MPSSPKYKCLFIFWVHHKHLRFWSLRFVVASVSHYSVGVRKEPLASQGLAHLVSLTHRRGQTQVPPDHVLCDWCHTDKDFPHEGSIAEKASWFLFSMIYLWEITIDMPKTHSIRRSLLRWQVPLIQHPKCSLTAVLPGQRCVPDRITLSFGQDSKWSSLPGNRIQYRPEEDK